MSDVMGRIEQLRHRELAAHERWQTLCEYVALFPNPVNVRREREVREERDGLRIEIAALRRELSATS